MVIYYVYVYTVEPSIGHLWYKDALYKQDTWGVLMVTLYIVTDAYVM